MSIIIRTIHLHKPYFLHGLVTQSCQVFTNLKVFLVTTTTCPTMSQPIKQGHSKANFLKK